MRLYLLSLTLTCYLALVWTVHAKPVHQVSSTSSSSQNLNVGKILKASSQSLSRRLRSFSLPSFLSTTSKDHGSQRTSDHVLASSSIEPNHPPRLQRLHRRAINDNELTAEEASHPGAKDFIGPSEEEEEMEEATVITMTQAEPTRFFSAYESIVNSESQLPVFLNQPQRRQQRRRKSQKSRKQKQQRKQQRQSNTETKEAFATARYAENQDGISPLVSNDGEYGPAIGSAGAGEREELGSPSSTKSDPLKEEHHPELRALLAATFEHADDIGLDLVGGDVAAENEVNLPKNLGQEGDEHIERLQRTLKAAIHDNGMEKELLEGFVETQRLIAAEEDVSNPDNAESLHRRFFDDDGNFEVDGEYSDKPMLPIDETFQPPVPESHSGLEEKTLFEDLKKDEPKVIFINDEPYIVDEPKSDPDLVPAESNLEQPSRSTYEPHNGHRDQHLNKDDAIDSENGFWSPLLRRRPSSPFTFTWKWPASLFPKSLSPTEVAVASCGLVFVGLFVLGLIVSYRLYLRRWQKGQNYYRMAYNIPPSDGSSSSISEKPMGFLKYLTTTLFPFGGSPFSKKAPFAGATSPMVFMPAQRKTSMVETNATTSSSCCCSSTAPVTGANAASNAEGRAMYFASQLRRTSSSHHHQSQLEQLMLQPQYHQQYPMSP